MIEDNAHSVQIAKIFLQRLGMRVTAAKDGCEALERLSHVLQKWLPA